jgi:hypothetical protein
MSLAKRIESFETLGLFLSQFSESGFEERNLPLNADFKEPFEMLINRAQETNPWFDKKQIYFSLENWSSALKKSSLDKWLDPYDIEDNPSAIQTIAVIMAGNIPLVGFHDFLSVLVSGHKIQIKLSSNDCHFIPMIARFLKTQNSDFKDKIEIVDKELSEYDAVIATGSDNTSRYFDYYFGKYPNIIRHNRNSVAVLSGNESPEELVNLGDDIFQYFGLGCRNVSKIYVPRDYDFDKLFKALYDFKDLTNNQRYMNNFDYNKAVFLMSQSKNMLENGFVLLKEDRNFSSPIATVFYEFYDSKEELQEHLDQNKDRIQCVVGGETSPYINFGLAQKPGLEDYADGIDTINFLKNLS